MEIEESESCTRLIGALGCVTKVFEKWTEKLEIHSNLGVLQKTASLGTAWIFRKAKEF